MEALLADAGLPAAKISRTHDGLSLIETIKPLTQKKPRPFGRGFLSSQLVSAASLRARRSRKLRPKPCQRPRSSLDP